VLGSQRSVPIQQATFRTILDTFSQSLSAFSSTLII